MKGSVFLDKIIVVYSDGTDISKLIKELIKSNLIIIFPPEASKKEEPLSDEIFSLPLLIPCVEPSLLQKSPQKWERETKKLKPNHHYIPNTKKQIRRR